MILQGVLLVALVGLSLLLFLMVRQVGLLSYRLGQASPPSEPSLEVGTRCPALEFPLAGGSERLKLPMAGTRESFLLFLSFSCPVCRVVLEEFERLPAEVTRRLVLMILDGNPRLGFPEEIERLERLEFPWVEGSPIVADFKVQHAPFLYVVGADGLIQEANPIYAFEDLVEILREFMPVVFERGVNHASAR